MAGRAGKALTVTLTKQMAERVKARVASGEYASESEVIRDGLRALEARRSIFVDDIEDWMRTEGPRVVAEYKANPNAGAPMDVVFRRVRKRMAQRRKASPKKAK